MAKTSSEEAAKKKNTSAKKASARNEKAAVETQSVQSDISPLMSEVLSIVFIGIGILLIVCLCSENGGIVGQAINVVLKGLFGFGAILLPISLIIASIYIFISDSKKIPAYKYIMFSIMFLDVVSIVHLIGAGENTYPSLLDKIKDTFANGSFSNGGLFGALIGDGLFTVLGPVATYIVLVILALVLLILITGKSFFTLVKTAYYWFYDLVHSYGYEYDYDDEDDEEYYVVNEPAAVRKRAVPEQLELELEPQTPRKKAKKASLDEYTQLLDNEQSKKKPVTFEIPEGKTKNQEPLSLILDDIAKHKKNASIETRLTKLGSGGYKMESYEVEDAPEIQEIPAEEDLPPFDLEDEVSTEVVAEPAPAPTPAPAKIDDDLLKAIPADLDEDVKAKIPLIIEAEEEKLVDRLHNDSKAEYVFPKLSFLGKNPNAQNQSNKKELLENARQLEETLKSFGVEATVDDISRGPTVTRYELTPSTGTRVNKIVSLEDDIALSLAAASIRIEAPIPGKKAIGIEIPNSKVSSVYFSEVLGTEKFKKFESKVAFGLGKDITGNVIVADIAKMPHLLIAGATGSGKSVCINTLIASILYKATPDEVKLIMVDPKVVELSVYNNIPHLLIPVVTDPKKAAGALNWAVREMMRRYQLFADAKTRNITGYNELETTVEKLPQIVIIIDELADLMMVAKKEVEDAICRLAQLARAAGMHLIVATQRPSVDVITGLIKANIPSRIAFAVSSSTDSRTILDTGGADKLLGKGDMLFKAVDMNKPLRVQGAFVTDQEVEKIVNFIKVDEPSYDSSIIEQISRSASGDSASASSSDSDSSDVLTDEVIAFLVKKKKASVGMVQRQFRIGYNRAARIIEDLEERGIVGPENGAKPREVYMDSYELAERQDRYSDI